MKEIDKSFIAILALIAALLFAASLFEHYRGSLLSAAGFITFLVVLQILDERFSKNPAVGMTCVALTDLNPEGKIEFADEATDAKAAKGCSIKSGEKCVIINFKGGLFIKGIYVVRPTDEECNS